MNCVKWVWLKGGTAERVNVWKKVKKMENARDVNQRAIWISGSAAWSAKCWFPAAQGEGKTFYKGQGQGHGKCTDIYILFICIYVGVDILLSTYILDEAAKTKILKIEIESFSNTPQLFEGVFTWLCETSPSIWICDCSLLLRVWG